jgi:DNA-binding response OmpR family regulator
VILERVWGMEFEPNTNVLDVRMSRLRTKVDGAGEKQLIQTVRGIGYLIKDS